MSEISCFYYHSDEEERQAFLQFISLVQYHKEVWCGEVHSLSNDEVVKKSVKNEAICGGEAKMCSPGGSAVAWILVMAMLSLVTQPSYPARYNHQERYNQACEMLIAIDEPLYRSQGQDLAKIKQLAKDHVNEINKIYHKVPTTNITQAFSFLSSGHLKTCWHLSHVNSCKGQYHTIKGYFKS